MNVSFWAAQKFLGNSIYGIAKAATDGSLKELKELSSDQLADYTGVLPDSAPNCVSAARSLALRDADVVVLVGARLNWMLHYGLAPRFGVVEISYPSMIRRPRKSFDVLRQWYSILKKQ